MSKFQPSRRRFLTAGSVVLGLPWLESLLSPALAQSGQSGAPIRLLAYYVPCGIHMEGWRLDNTGALSQLSPILSPLANSDGVDLRPHVEVLSGLANLPAKPQASGDHASGTGGFLTCTKVNKSETKIRAGVSMDQLYARKVGSQTSLASLQLGTDGGANTGNCDSGYGCAYSRNISWSDESTPLPKLTDPRMAFDLLFSGQDQGLSQQEVLERRTRRKSVLDRVLSQSKALTAQLSAKDRHKLDGYMSGIRDLELRIEKGSTEICESGTWKGEFANYAEKVDLLLDLCVLAMSCDATRVLTFMHGNAGSGRSHAFLGVPESHHDLSHHGGNKATQAKLQTINTWEIERLARLLAKMSRVTEGEHTLLHNSLVFFSSEISDGNRHNHDDLPVLLAGHAGGAFASGRHRVFKGAPISELFMGMLELLGAPQTSFGDDGKQVIPGFLG